MSGIKIISLMLIDILVKDWVNGFYVVRVIKQLTSHTRRERSTIRFTWYIFVMLLFVVLTILF